MKLWESFSANFQVKQKNEEKQLEVIDSSKRISITFSIAKISKLHFLTDMQPYSGFVIEFPSREGVAFHMSVRMGLHGGENTIVLNNMRNGG